MLASRVAMSTAQLIRPAGALPAHPERAAARHTRAPIVLLASLLVLTLYAAFAHGAVATGAESRVQVALAAIAAIAASIWLWSGTLRFAAPRLAYGGLALLGLFAAWSGASLAWSVAPDQTWLELNRAITYVLVAFLAVMLGASHRRSLELVASGFLLVVLAVTAYALAQKLFPGLGIQGLFNLNQTGPLPRLQEPFGYWNALALFIAMGVPIALGVIVDRARSATLRLGMVVALQLMLLTIALTYSRGGLLALALALAAGIGLSRAALRSLLWLATAAVAAVPPLIVGLSSHALTTAEVSLARREGAGLLLALVLLLSSLALLAAGRELLERERRVRLTDTQALRVRRALLGVVVGALLVALLATALSSRGLGGTFSHAWRSFTATRGTNISDPHHLLSADSENRWVWWKEAAGAASDRPLTGWGAGSFGVVHLLYRRDNLSVKQPHSVPLQWLAETGVVGALVAMLAFALLLAAAVRAVKRWPLGTERLLAAALFAGALAYVIHSLFDWDWDIPGVTFPALLLLGVLAGSARSEEPHRIRSASPGSSGVAVGLVALLLCTFVLSVTLPRVAAGKASSALIVASSGAPSALAQAQSSAAFAARLDPLSDAGLLAQATISLRAGQRSQARSYYLQAVNREPSDVQAWTHLADLDVTLGDVTGAARDIQHVVDLDPRGQQVALLRYEAQIIAVLKARPKDSATAAPLPATTG
ncbi:MAG: O-antigen ligase family protein [Solirubrobacterales bacterium]|nr:O-antigen ligase family protein [Solirubrobacterales bacterium]